MLEIDKLISLEKTDNQHALVLAYILRQSGFSDSDVERAIRMLTHVGKAIKKDCDGKLQRFLRRHGEIIRDELVGTLRAEWLSEEQLRYAISHWLQNALSFPISLEHSAVTEFRRKNEATMDDLLSAADELAMNIAIVDDLLEAEQNAQAAVTNEQLDNG